MQLPAVLLRNNIGRGGEIWTHHVYEVSARYVNQITPPLWLNIVLSFLVSKQKSMLQNNAEKTIRKMLQYFFALILQKINFKNIAKNSLN